MKGTTGYDAGNPDKFYGRKEFHSFDPDTMEYGEYRLGYKEGQEDSQHYDDSAYADEYRDRHYWCSWDSPCGPLCPEHPMNYGGREHLDDFDDDYPFGLTSGEWATYTRTARAVGDPNY